MTGEGEAVGRGERGMPGRKSVSVAVRLCSPTDADRFLGHESDFFKKRGPERKRWSFFKKGVPPEKGLKKASCFCRFGRSVVLFFLKKVVPGDFGQVVCEAIRPWMSVLSSKTGG